MNRARWIALVVGGCTLSTAWAQWASVDFGLPPRTSDTRERTPHDELRAADYLYREYVRADSLLPLLPDTPGIRTMLSSLLPLETADTIRAVIRDDSAQIGELRARIGVFLVDGRLGQRPGNRVDDVLRREIHVGTDAIGPYCAMVATGYVVRDSVMVRLRLDVIREGIPQRQPGTSVLGPCVFVARYGAPGPGIARWLEDGAYRFASLSGVAAREFDHRAESTTRWYYWTKEDRLLHACRGGRVENCAAAMTLVTRTAADRQGPATYRSGYDYLNESGMTRTLLYDIEQQFGRDRFARFWSSEQDMTAAFASAFGTESGMWVHDWTEAHWDRAVLGARVDAFSLLLSVLCLVGFVVAATVVAVRRQV